MNPILRIVGWLFAVLVVIYGIHGVVVNDLYIPGKNGPGLDLHGVSTWLGLLSFLAGIAMVRNSTVVGPDGRTQADKIRYLLWGALFVGLTFAAVFLNKKS